MWNDMLSFHVVAVLFDRETIGKGTCSDLRHHNNVVSLFLNLGYTLNPSRSTFVLWKKNSRYLVVRGFNPWIKNICYSGSPGFPKTLVLPNLQPYVEWPQNAVCYFHPSAFGILGLLRISRIVTAPSSPPTPLVEAIYLSTPSPLHSTSTDVERQLSSERSSAAYHSIPQHFVYSS